MKEKFNITGMGCAACSARIEKGINKMTGVTKAQVNLLTNTMEVEYDGGQITSQEIINEVDELGYGATSGESDEDEDHPSNKIGQEVTIGSEADGLKKRFLISLVFMLPLFYLSMGHMMNWPMPMEVTGHMDPWFLLVQGILALPIVIVNYKYYTVGLFMLAKKSPNMDSLIAIGSLASLVLFYFESAAMILTLVTLGKYLEARAKKKTGEAINKLIELTPDTIHVLRDGEELEIPIESVRIGETVVIRPGETIGVDGIILTGETSVDQSAITGESMPVDKSQGEEIIAGTVNQKGYITYEATKVGKDTTLAKIIELVEEAASSKAPISQLADKVSSIFVPVVICIAVVAAVIWSIIESDINFAINIGISVLVISCPCALGLATPVAIMVATGKGAGEGILIKSAEALETLHNIDAIVFDKTGTITQGKPSVTDIVTFNQADKGDLLKICASLENQSEHPLGKAVCKNAEEKGISMVEVTNFQYTFGKGIYGEILGKGYFAGNLPYIEGTIQNISNLDSLKEYVNTLQNQGKTLIIVSDDTIVLGIIALADKIKVTAKDALESIRKMGIKEVLLTGDNKNTGQAIGKQVGIEEIVAEVLPDEKEKVIRDLQENGYKVAMVGDGINDAPAIMRADVGMAIGAGTDIAIEAADIVLMGDDLADVGKAIKLSRATITNIKRSLFWAFFYNILGIPVAAGVLYPAFAITLNPMIAAAAMSLSSVCVVTNALLLKRKNL
ncbi:MAG: heavy metal translocating P-type ATPase [Anaerovoracaceae bacterium]